MFGKATVTLSDVTAGNGVVHAIDEVLFATPSMPTDVETSTKDDDTISIETSTKDDAILIETSTKDDAILTEMSKNDVWATRVLKKDISSILKKKKNLVDLCRDLGYTSFAAAMTLTGIDKVTQLIINRKRK
jgi:hypothetical protein